MSQKIQLRLRNKCMAEPDYNLEIINAVLLGQCHPDKNGKLTPEDKTSDAQKLQKIWWICNKSHEWEARISAKFE